METDKERITRAIEKLKCDLREPADPSLPTPAEGAYALAKQMDKDLEEMVARTRFDRFWG